MPRYFIKFAYNGAAYHGWQLQPNAKTVQEILDTNLSLFLKQNIETVGAGRTDAGVHASCMYAHFDCSYAIEDQTQFVFRINKMLPDDIAVFELIKVCSQAHARFDALSRTYKYYVHQFKNPFLKEHSLYLFGKLDIDRMNQACKLLLSYKDFACFGKSHSDVKTTLCDVTFAQWELNNKGQLVFTIRANRFLRNMVRAIVGTLLEVGKHKLSLDDFKNILESKNRSKAGKSVPAKALFLVDIQYPQTIFI